MFVLKIVLLKLFWCFVNFVFGIFVKMFCFVISRVVVVIEIVDVVVDWFNFLVCNCVFCCCFCVIVRWNRWRGLLIVWFLVVLSLFYLYVDGVFCDDGGWNCLKFCRCGFGFGWDWCVGLLGVIVFVWVFFSGICINFFCFICMIYFLEIVV